MQKTYEKALQKWDVIVEGLRFDSYIPNRRAIKDSLITTYKNREAFAKTRAKFATYAVITPDGEWHAQGDVGWFGIDNDTTDKERDWHDHYKERFINTADPEWILTIIDCHI